MSLIPVPSAQSEERQHGKDHDDQSDQVDDAVHRGSPSKKTEINDAAKQKFLRRGNSPKNGPPPAEAAGWLPA
jgi:hypothetical protein